jgi:hypothetical protein
MPSPTGFTSPKLPSEALISCKITLDFTVLSLNEDSHLSKTGELMIVYIFICIQMNTFCKCQMVGWVWLSLTHSLPHALHNFNIVFFDPMPKAALGNAEHLCGFGLNTLAFFQGFEEVITFLAGKFLINI